MVGCLSSPPFLASYSALIHMIFFSIYLCVCIETRAKNPLDGYYNMNNSSWEWMDGKTESK